MNLSIDKQIIDIWRCKYKSALQITELLVCLGFVVGETLNLIIENSPEMANSRIIGGLTGLTYLIVYILRRKEKISQDVSGYLFSYFMIVNILAADALYLFITPNATIFDTNYTNSFVVFMLLQQMGSFLINPRHILVIGLISLVRIWILTLLVNSNHYWSIMVFENLTVIGFSLALYLVHMAVLGNIVHNYHNEQRVGQQNEELSNFLRLKKELMSLIVHDIKNPLNRILLASNNDIIRKQDIAEPGYQILSTVENILDVSKMEEAKFPLHNEVIDVENVLTKSINNVCYLLRNKNITIDIAEYVNRKVIADKEILVRVLDNLLTNAIKASNQNSIIKVNVLSKRGVIRIEVIDEGMGMDEETLSHIFEKYFHSKNLLYFGNMRSTGLGLTFCKLAIESMGGVIGVKSIVNEGSTFWFEFPFVEFVDNKIYNDKLTTSESSTLEFTEGELDILRTYIQQIELLAIYQTGKILSILKSIPETSPSITAWKDKLTNASLTRDDKQFKELLNQQQETNNYHTLLE